MQKVLFAAFDAAGNADRALIELEAHGFNPKDLSIITKETSREGHPVATGAAEGALTGGVLGGLAGLLAGAGIIPIIGGILIGGPIAAALGLTGLAAAAATGAITGAVAGGLIGTLVNLGFSREEAEYYRNTVESGGLLLGIPVDETTELEAEAILAANHAEQVRLIRMDQYRFGATMDDEERSVLSTADREMAAPVRETSRHPRATRKTRTHRKNSR